MESKHWHLIGYAFYENKLKLDILQEDAQIVSLLWYHWTSNC